MLAGLPSSNAEAICRASRSETVKMDQTQGWNPEVARQHYQGREIQIYGRNAVAFDGSTTHKADYVSAGPLEESSARWSAGGWGCRGLPIAQM